jgi:23S rRNA (adenine-N6)-dimethyltransferase
VAVRRPARDALGRHFLRSSRLAADLVDAAGVASCDLVVDIGAGSGALTRALADAGAEVIALELSPHLVAELRRRFGGTARVSVVETDVLDWNWPTCPFSVVANLPFVGSGAILSHLLRDPRHALRSVYAIVQWELAEKHAAVWPATLKGTYWRAWYDVTVAWRLHRSSFAPPPSVDAGILCFRRRARPLVAEEEAGDYWGFLRSAFGARVPVRAALSPRITPLQVKRLAPTLGFARDARARDLDARQWAGLYAEARRE